MDSDSKLPFLPVDYGELRHNWAARRVGSRPPAGEV